MELTSRIPSRLTLLVAEVEPQRGTVFCSVCGSQAPPCLATDHEEFRQACLVLVALQELRRLPSSSNDRRYAGPGEAASGQVPEDIERQSSSSVSEPVALPFQKQTDTLGTAADEKSAPCPVSTGVADREAERSSVQARTVAVPATSPLEAWYA